MKIILEVLNFKLDSIDLLKDIQNACDANDILGVMQINEFPPVYFGETKDINKAKIIHKILEKRVEEDISALLLADLLLDIEYPSGHTDIYGVTAKEMSDIDYYDVIREVLTYYPKGKEALLEVKIGKIYSLHSGELLTKFYIKKGKIGYKN